MAAGKNLLNTVRSIEEGELSLVRRCELLGVNRSSVYCLPATGKTVDEMTEDEREKTKKAEEDKEAMMRIIDDLHNELPETGARKMARAIRKQGYECTRHQAGKLMVEMNVKPVYPQPNTSKPAKGHPKSPYLLKGKKIWLPNQVWAVDITYIRCGKGHMYLTAIIDWHSRLIVGWKLSDTLEATPVIECVREAVGRYGEPCIINSDQGSTFVASGYIELLASHGIRQSMDGRGRWIDNVRIERWFRTLKSGHLKTIEYSTPRELRHEIDAYIPKYNNVRLHESLDYITPRECYEVAFENAA